VPTLKEHAYGGPKLRLGCVVTVNFRPGGLFHFGFRNSFGSLAKLAAAPGGGSAARLPELRLWRSRLYKYKAKPRIGVTVNGQMAISQPHGIFSKVGQSSDALNRRNTSKLDFCFIWHTEGIEDSQRFFRAVREISVAGHECSDWYASAKSWRRLGRIEPAVTILHDEMPRRVSSTVQSVVALIMPASVLAKSANDSHHIELSKNAQNFGIQ